MSERETTTDLLKRLEANVDAMWRRMVLGYAAFAVCFIAWSVFAIETGLANLLWGLFALAFMIPWLFSAVRVHRLTTLLKAKGAGDE